MLMLPKRFVFVDVGSYHGLVSKQYMLFLRADPARFYLIEPNPINFEISKTNMPGANLYPCAISDHDGTETLYYDDNFLNASSLFEEMAAGKGGTVESTEVDCCTMDSFMVHADIEKIDFLKINCEGGELVMFGAPTLDFLDRTTYILISWHGKRDVFNNDKATADKSGFNKILLNSGFRFLDGVKPEVIGQQGWRTHELQFWKKD